MAVTEVYATWRATCDCCKATEEMVSKGRPKHWIDLHILRDAYDFHDCAVADGSVKLLLCTTCADSALKAMNTSFDKARALTQGAT
jgi:hypothetical protein